MSKKTPTVGERLRKLAQSKYEEALKRVDEWEKSCLWHMENAAKNQQRCSTDDVEVHSTEAAKYGSYDDFVAEFDKAAKALKKRLEADGSVTASYAFKQTKDETIDGGMEQSWRDVRHYPASYKLVFKIRW